MASRSRTQTVQPACTCEEYYHSSFGKQFLYISVLVAACVKLSQMQAVLTVRYTAPNCGDTQS
jgi:hypothetical protein